jgi:hypothetical protein
MDNIGIKIAVTTANRAATVKNDAANPNPCDTKPIKEGPMKKAQ